ncbi:Gfo/Idh/MocA family oxidoreductase [Aureimonas sp. Leaf324]|jgi:predicted dehydrogenase|uniref:Gfo/Idh/MocA family protein n=1 Tax=Aureimonas sp. Leaf324 TaxID=1736336 RepID=UPI0006FE2F3F|nr:Gfo/Idh/MocA family oxidoreductase [Aureimonas sp. Leaf324]KQQ81850.1 oxidoreductase [Aureimonas sp. Leaf324]
MARMGIGIIGCGNIAATYLRNARLFGDVALVACADRVPEMAERRAADYGMRAMSVEALLAEPDVQLVLNLTIPAAHREVTEAALGAGKHVFTEKPLGVTLREGRALVEEAERRGLSLGSAPDTFLGAAGRRARALIDAGAIGKPVIGTAFMMGRGMEHWHPNPQFYYQPGGGPVLDMGPYYLTMLVNLLGPVARVSAVARTGQEMREITAEGPFHGTRFPVATPTSLLSLLEFRSGAAVTFGASWDVFRHSNHPIELHGTEGSIRLPDPDTFGGDVSLSARGEPWREHPSEPEPFGAINWPFDEPRIANYRMLGVADLVRSITEGRPARASGRLALHVLEVMEAILTAADTGQPIGIEGRLERPAALGDAEATALLSGDPA